MTVDSQDVLILLATTTIFLLLSMMVLASSHQRTTVLRLRRPLLVACLLAVLWKMPTVMSTMERLFLEIQFLTVELFGTSSTPMLIIRRHSTPVSLLILMMATALLIPTSLCSLRTQTAP